MPQRTHSGRLATIASVLALLTLASYGLLNLSHPWHLAQHELSLFNQLLIWLVSDDFVRGDTAVDAQTWHNYTHAFAGISTHTLLGAVALISCALQFVPGLRQRAPRWHRGVGAVAVVSTLASMGGAMVYLYQTPAQHVFSGEPFAAALWVQAISTLFALSLAIRSIRQRDIRSHMGWMTLLLAGLMTAPLLRIGYVLAGNLLSLRVAQVNAGVAVLLFPLATLLATWWMTHVGRHEFSLQAPKPSMIWPAWQALAWLGAATALHEGLLAPMGLDALTPWRTTADRLPLAAGVWGLATALLLPRLTPALKATMQGAPIDRPTLGLGMLASVGGGLIASQLPAESNNQIGQLCFWYGLALSGLAMSAAGLMWQRQSKQLSPWRVLTLAAWFTPSMWLPVGLALSWTGWSASAIQTATLTITWGMFFWHGFVSGFGLPMPGVPVASAHAGKPAGKSAA